jgi:hypothetical protein
MMFFCLLLLQRLLSSTPLKHRLMNSEMNDNNRKNYSKTIAMGVTGFLLVAAAFAFLFADFGQQSAIAQQQGGNATTTTIVTTAHSTFTANGPITGTVQAGEQQGGGGNQSAGGGGNQSAGGGGNQSAGGGGGGGQESPYLLGGNWTLSVQNGNVTNFGANFIMVHPDGSEYHTHDINGFRIGNNTITWTPGLPLMINGTADIDVNGTTKWTGVETNLTFSQNAAIMTIMPSAEDTDNHFQGQPIYGIVAQATGENGTMILQPPGGGPVPAQTQAQQGGNQTGGGPLESLTKPLQDLFGGGGK